MQPQLIIFLWLLAFGQCLSSKFLSQEFEDGGRVIIIDQDGTSDLECCMYGNCLCFNLSLTLEHLQDDTEIRIQSDISLHKTVVFGNISNVKLAGDNNPTVRCDHQGGLVGKNINYIAIQGITWDSCNGISMVNFTKVHIVDSAFLNANHFALTLHGLGSVNINGSTFSHNNGGIDILASSVYIYGSKFYADRKTAILVNTMNDDNTLALHNILSNVTIKYCRFSSISEHSVYSIGNLVAGLLPIANLLILSTNFTNNTNTAVNVEHCNVTLNNVLFYDNVNVNNGYVNDGGAVRVYNGALNMTGEVLFSYNGAGNNGGAIYLNHSVMFALQGSFLFHNNTADYGGALYIGQGSRLYFIRGKANLKFFNNNASKGEIMYIDLNDVQDATYRYQLSSYYFDLLISMNCLCDFSENACTNNCAYFNTQLSSVHSPLENFNYHPYQMASSVHCDIYPNSYNSTVNVYSSNISPYDGSLKFWSHDLHLDVIINDCHDFPTGPINASFKCCSDAYIFPHSCIINSQTGSFTVTGNNSMINCPNYNTITCDILVENKTSGNIYVTVQRFGHVCDDIAHAYFEIAFNAYCLPICSYIIPLISSEENCVRQNILPGYWYDNAFKQYVTFCPTAYCNQQFHLDNLLFRADAIFPDRDIQCSANWRGLACGKCNYSANYTIKYDTTECVPAGECLTTSVTSSLLILFGVSLFYWIVIISFIFIMLHFRFDITTGYAYGLLFYYSVLEQIVNDGMNYLDSNLESSQRYDIYDNYDNHEFDSYVGTNDFMRFKILPFLSSMGNLKPPFTKFMRLCLGDAEMIDHLMLQYIHPLIVSFLVIIIFMLARNFVLVAGTIGRYVNTKSICILLLLSYSSITYTSMQLLKPLPVFKQDGSHYSFLQVYWSPTMKYFQSRHILYAITAILCELIIGFGIPLVLIFHRYLIYYCNLNFTSIIPVMDQLKGCYKEEYRWFVAYYLICRQVLYGTNNLTDYFLGFQNKSTYDTIGTPFPKFTIMLIVCILIMTIHVWFQPYKAKGLNILDSFILLCLVGLLVSALEVYWNRMIGVIFWFLPLLIFINYLAYFTGLKYFTIPCTCAAVFGVTFMLAFEGIFAMFFLASSSIIFLAYIIYVVKSLYTRCCKARRRYLAINNHNDEADVNNDDNIAEVQDW